MKKMKIVLTLVVALIIIILIFNLLLIDKKDIKRNQSPEAESVEIENNSIQYYNDEKTTKEKMTGDSNEYPSQEEYNNSEVLYEDDDLKIHDMNIDEHGVGPNTLTFSFIIEYKNIEKEVLPSNFIYKIAENHYYATEVKSTGKGFLEDPTLEYMAITIEIPKQDIKGIYYYTGKTAYKLTSFEIEKIINDYNENGSGWELKSSEDGVETWNVTN